MSGSFRSGSCFSFATLDRLFEIRFGANELCTNLGKRSERNVSAHVGAHGRRSLFVGEECKNFLERLGGVTHLLNTKKRRGFFSHFKDFLIFF